MSVWQDGWVWTKAWGWREEEQSGGALSLGEER